MVRMNTIVSVATIYLVAEVSFIECEDNFKSSSSRESRADIQQENNVNNPNIRIFRKRFTNRSPSRYVHMLRESTMAHKNAFGSKNISNIGDLSSIIRPYTITQDMERIAWSFPKANITVEVIGRTEEYNDIVLMKMNEKKLWSFRAPKYADEAPEKKIVFIVHGLTVMGMNFLPQLTMKGPFNELLSYYVSHLDKFDIFLMPMANPDGLNTHKKFWNKNLSPQTACPGVALDRNFDIAWNTSEVLSSCNPRYPGPTPFSEPETRAVRDILQKNSQKIIAYFHVHAGSYDTKNLQGEGVLYPKGYTDAVSEEDKYIDLKGEIEEVMRNANFKIVSVAVETLYSWYGPIFGSSVDYASSVYGIPYALELVMQPYESHFSSETNDPNFQALHHIWKRVLDVIFNSIHKSISEKDDNNN